ncbi:glycosyltransferase family 2 protein [Haloferax larsenii]|uniref:Glycosyltransferase involved in cell wall bisynthesis n=1 Tax=Haloferax larsenii TaxID=302484 RepID=A0A1H7PY71_HALLR|nr:glycosyltransferase family 2 protein [Haloferax larsenii]SEL40673.1 Glycosyltransferase involved in cell wall bisynthesis [Haloferax larsenii]
MSDSNPLVSVVLPTYNRPDGLRQAVASVAAQTYSPIELVVVDDHSEIPAREVLDEPTVGVDAIHQVRIIRHPTNRGGNAARNTGIRAATGRFVAFHDDDDEWYPEKLARQVDVFGDVSETVGLVYTGTEYREAGKTVQKQTGGVRGDATRSLLLGGSLSEFSGVMVRRSVVDDAGLPDERFPSWQDREWFVRLSQHCRFASVDEALTIRYVEGGDRVTKRFETKRDESFPLFVEQFRPLARQLGVERQFVAAHRAKLGKEALRTGYYGDARRLLALALLGGHVDSDTLVHLSVALGGRVTYQSAKRLARAVRARGVPT